MARQHIPVAICYDFDGTLAPGYMQNRDFIPKIGMKNNSFWKDVQRISEEHNADNILVYMHHMLKKAEAAAIQVRRENFQTYGEKLDLFNGVYDWFDRINTYGKTSGIKIEHYIISSGIKEMIEGTSINKYFRMVYASSFIYDHHGVACWPALAINYTTKTQFLFRINKGCLEVYDHSVINDYIPHMDRRIPFERMIFIGDGETDVPCFRLVKEQGGHAISVYKPGSPKGKNTAEKLLNEGRVNFALPADYSESKGIDLTVKAIIEKIAADRHLYGK